MVGAGLITIAVLCSEFVIVLIMRLLGLTPEQRALAGAKREGRDADRRWWPYSSAATDLRWCEALQSSGGKGVAILRLSARLNRNDSDLRRSNLIAA